MLDTKKIWDTSLTEIQLAISKANFMTWFKNTYVIREDRGTIYIGVPNEFVKEWLETKFHKDILRALRNTHESVRAVEYIIAQQKDADSSSEQTYKPVSFINR